MANFWETKFGVGLRWVLVPIASILGSTVLFEVFVYWFNLQYGMSTYMSGIEVTDISKIILDIVLYFLYGGTFVLSGVYTAPSHRKNVSIVLATLLGCICLFAFIYNLNHHGGFVSIANDVIMGIGGIMAVTYTSENFE